MIDKAHDLPVVRPCQILELPRSSVYYRPTPVSGETLRLMRRIDELHMAHSFYGSRKFKVLLRREECDIGRRHVRTLMGRMGIEALYRKPRLSVPGDGHRIYPLSAAGHDD